MGLTERELEVVRLIGAGYRNAEIAALLRVAKNTVRNRVSSILAKLELHDRTQIAVYAWRNGLMREQA